MLNRMETIDQEVLALRYFFEQPGRAEVAQVLGIDEAGAER
jgi:DNA-directed RNA polymerase specialized sigma subunit